MGKKKPQVKTKIKRVNGFKKVEGAHIRVADITLLGNAMMDYYREHGIAPQAVDLLKIATPKKSPIHHTFIWDDRKAGYQYRLNQSRYYIRSIQLEWVDLEDIVHTEKLHYHLLKNPKTKEPAKHENISSIFERADEIQMLEKQAYNDLQSWVKRFEKIGEIAKKVDIESLKKAINNFNRRQDRKRFIA